MNEDVVLLWPLLFEGTLKVNTHTRNLRTDCGGSNGSGRGEASGFRNGNGRGYGTGHPSGDGGTGGSANRQTGQR